MTTDDRTFDRAWQSGLNPITGQEEAANDRFRGSVAPAAQAQERTSHAALESRARASMKHRGPRVAQREHLKPLV